MKEEWREVKGYEGLYRVSSTGKVKSLLTGISMKQAANHKGYLIVQLSNKGQRKNKRVHRLVAEAFILNPDGLPEVDHINGIRQDNRADNLRWVSGSTNTRNREVCRRASSQYNGVHWDIKLGRWKASIWHERKTKSLGYFTEETEAAKAFNSFCTSNNLNRELNIIVEDSNGCGKNALTSRTPKSTGNEAQSTQGDSDTLHAERGAWCY